MIVIGLHAFCPPFDTFVQLADRTLIVSKGVFSSYGTLKLFLNSPAQPGVFNIQKEMRRKPVGFAAHPLILFWLISQPE